MVPVRFLKKGELWFFAFFPQFDQPANMQNGEFPAKKQEKYSMSVTNPDLLVTNFLPLAK